MRHPHAHVYIGYNANQTPLVFAELAVLLLSVNSFFSSRAKLSADVESSRLSSSLMPLVAIFLLRQKTDQKI